MNLGETVDNIKESISDAISEKPQIVAVVAGVLLLFVVALGILAWQTSPRKAKAQTQNAFTLDAPILAPDEPKIENSYYQYRATGAKWTDAESREFFTAPDESVMDSLEKANDKISEEITEAVP